MTKPKDKRSLANAATNVGNNRDLMARFNSPLYSPWQMILPAESIAPVKGNRRVLPKIDPTAPEEIRRAEKNRRNREFMRAKRAATRINKPLQICVQGGEKVQREAIRKEMAAA